MTEAGRRLIEGATEALAVARGEIPAARITIKGQHYVPEAELKAERQRWLDCCSDWSDPNAQRVADLIATEAVRRASPE